MKKKITNNLGLKILAVIFSVILWLIVVNIDDPVMTTTYNGIVVEIQNADVIADDNKTYQVLEGTDTISVTVTAKKSIINALSKENIHAVADLSELTFMNTVGIHVTTDKYSDAIDNIKSSTVNLKLNIEDVAEKQLALNVSTSGTPANGYMIGDVTTAQNVLRISGPQSVIESIMYAEAIVDVSETESDVKTNAEIRLYDADHNLIANNSIIKNINTVNITVSILVTRSIPLSYNVMGTPVSGYMLTGELTSDPERITVAGKKDVINSLAQIDIPETALNVTGQSSDMTAIVDVTKHLPEGVILADDDFNGKSTVVVYIEKQATLDKEILAENITVTNIPSDMDAEILDLPDRIDLTLLGLKEDLDQLEELELSGTIDLEALCEELELDELVTDTQYVATVRLNIPERVTLQEEIAVVIRLNEKQ